MTRRFHLTLALAIAGFAMGAVALGLQCSRSEVDAAAPVAAQQFGVKASDLAELDKRIARLEQAAARPSTNVVASPSGQLPPHAEPEDEDELPERIATVIEDERQSVIDRRIALRQEVDRKALTAFATTTPLTEARRLALEDVLFGVTEQITVLIDEGTNAVRPWDAIRADMKDTTNSGIDELRGLLSDEEFERFAAISREHGTALIIPESSPPPTQAESIMQ